MTHASSRDELLALADPDSRFATFDGIDVHYKVRDEAGADAPNVVLLHHFYGNVFTWRHVLEGLAPTARVSAFDRPGFGLTQRPPRSAWNGANPYTRASSSRMTLALMDTLGMDTAVLVGSSAGGTSALETYARAPERVSALVLLSPAITGDVGPPSSVRRTLGSGPARRVGQRLVRRLGRDITPERVGGSWFDPSKVTDDDVDAYARPLGAPGWETGLWELITAEPPPSLTRLLARVEVPSLVVTGDSDRVVSPAATRRTAATISGAELVVLPRCGHTPQEECPDALLEAVAPFLATVA